MTDSIDLDELGESKEEEADPDRNRGDWFWQNEAEEAATTESEGETASADAPQPAESDPGDVSASGNETTEGPDARMPHVPREGASKPAGIPKERGGSGSGAGDGDDDAPEHGEAAEEAEASGPHGGGIDEMTTAFTYEAIRTLANPAAAVADSRQWSDHVGIVGEVPAHAINKFQREHVVDADFFNGAGDGPTERLAGIDEHSMFYAERMVVLGLPDQSDLAPEGWEFVPLSEAAEKAGWEQG